MSFSFSILLLVFCLLGLLITESGVLKNLTKIMDSSILPFTSNESYLMHFEAVVFGAYVVRTGKFSW